MKCKSGVSPPKAAALASVLVVFAWSETSACCLLYRLADSSSQKGWCFLFSGHLKTQRHLLVSLLYMVMQAEFYVYLVLKLLCFPSSHWSLFCQKSPFYYVVWHIFLGIEIMLSSNFRRGCFSERKANYHEGKEEIFVICCESLVYKNM